MSAEDCAEDCAADCDERTACPQVGGIGHWQCGICPEHNEPRHHCGCMVYEPVSAPERTEAEMAERIAAFEAAPAAPESWTGSQVAVDLRMAADVLERDGWGQFTYHYADRKTDTPCHCASGAIAVGITGNVWATPTNPRHFPEYHRWNDAAQALAESLVDFDNVPDWNDDRDRTAAEVIAAIRAAADKADQP